MEGYIVEFGSHLFQLIQNVISNVDMSFSVNCLVRKQKLCILNSIITNSWILSSFSFDCLSSCPNNPYFKPSHADGRLNWAILEQLFPVDPGCCYNHLTFSSFFLQIWSTSDGRSIFWSCLQNNLDHRLPAVGRDCAMLSGFLLSQRFSRVLDLYGPDFFIMGGCNKTTLKEHIGSLFQSPFHLECKIIHANFQLFRL